MEAQVVHSYMIFRFANKCAETVSLLPGPCTVYTHIFRFMTENIEALRPIFPLKCFL